MRMNLFRVLEETVLGSRDCPDQTVLRAHGTTERRSRSHSSTHHNSATRAHLHRFRASPPGDMYDCVESFGKLFHRPGIRRKGELGERADADAAGALGQIRAR